MLQVQQPSTNHRASLEEAIRRVTELRPFPETASRLLSACQSEASSSQMIAEIVKHDPGVAARLLRIANSSMYGQAGRVRTIEQAIVLLGLRCVSDIAVAIAGQDLMNHGETSVAERRILWKHSLACAVVARTVAAVATDVRPEEAFLAGIFHDIGKLLFYDIVPDDYSQAVADVSLDDLLESERTTFGMTHESVGACCARQWGLSSAVRSAIGFHHRPEQSTDDSPLVLVTAAANALAHEWQLGCPASGQAPTNLETWTSSLGLCDDDLATAADRATAEFEEALEVCTLS